MPYVLSIDPGMSSGIVLGEFTPETPYTRLGFWQIEGGLSGLRHWLGAHHEDTNDGTMLPPWWFFPAEDDPDADDVLGFENDELVIVCEKFSPRPMARSFKLEELEAIRIEGVVEDRFEGMVTWQRPMAMVLDGRPDTTAKRKQASDNVLRKMGLWTTGKQVGLKDANDVNSAQKHAVAYLIKQKHEPTVKKILEVTSC